jgi:hypothetical protein
MDLTPLSEPVTVLAVAKALEPYVTKMLGPAFDAIGGTIGDPVEEWRKDLAKRRSERASAVVFSAARKIQASGAEPIRIPDYIAVPLLERATLVDDEGLREMWASLLANAAIPDISPRVSTLFTTILSNLSPRQAKFLEVIFNASVQSIFIKIRPIAPVAIVNHSRMDDDLLTSVVGNTDFRWQSNDEKAEALETLMSQGVLRRDQEIDPKSYSALAGRLLAEGKLKTPHKLPTDVMVHMKDFYQLTITGAEFVLACRPFDRRP